MDWGREARTGIGEAVFCAGKTPDQINGIVHLARTGGRRLLLTRLEHEQFHCLDAGARGALDFDAPSRTATLGGPAPEAASDLAIIVCAGTSDVPVALEARRTLAFYGVAAPLIGDVGVAGLWRLLDRIEEIAAFPVVIAVAGMEGALFSVLAGAVPGLVIAVPSSVGYGVAQGGTTALHSALASCAPGVVAVNIDNGFGAACAALKALRRAKRPV
ncbi:MAG TPA: nickel pincer cofactor biosynthesis protein LarB [Stellaceae bacterium]|nr:nickel pincer cofactor biosynthesis protein LarB [Stellaceae bacterium]